MYDCTILHIETYYTALLHPYRAITITRVHPTQGLVCFCLPITKPCTIHREEQLIFNGLLYISINGRVKFLLFHFLYTLLYQTYVVASPIVVYPFSTLHIICLIFIFYCFTLGTFNIAS